MVLDLEEPLELSNVELAHGVDPHTAVGLVPVQVLHFFEDVDGEGGLGLFVERPQLVDAFIVVEVVAEEDFFEHGLGLHDFLEVAEHSLVGEEVEAESQDPQVRVLVANQGVDDRLQALVPDPVVAQLQELEDRVVGDDVLSDGLGPIVADFVVENVEVAQALVLGQGLGQLGCTRHAHVVLAEVEHLEHVVVGQHFGQLLESLLLQEVLGEVEHFELTLEAVPPLVEGEDEDVGHGLAEAGGAHLEGVEVGAVGEEFDELGLLLVEEFVVVGEVEVGVEVGAEVQLQGLEVVEELLLVVAGDHLRQLVGVAVPLLLVVLADVHALVQRYYAHRVPQCADQVGELQAPLPLRVEGHRHPHLLGLARQVAAVAEVQHPQTAALAEGVPELAVEGGVEPVDLAEVEDFDAGADFEHFVEGYDGFVDLVAVAGAALEGDVLEVEDGEVGAEGEVVDDGGKAGAEALLGVKPEDLELLHAHEGIGEGLALVLVEGAPGELHLLQVLQLDEQVAEHLHGVAVGEDVGVAEAQGAQVVGVGEVGEEALGDVGADDDVVEGEGVEAALALLEVAQSLLDGLGGLVAELVVHLLQPRELDVLEGGQLAQQGGDVVVGRLQVVHLHHRDQDGVDVVGGAHLQLLVEGAEVGVHVDVLQEVLQVQPQEQPLPVRLRDVDLRLLVAGVALLELPVHDRYHPVLGLGDALLGHVERLQGDLSGGEFGVRQHCLLDPRPPPDAHVPPVLLHARLLLDLQLVLLALPGAHLDVLAVGGDVLVELLELLLAGGQFGLVLDLGGRLLALRADGLLPLLHLELVVVGLLLRVADGLLEQGGDLGLGAGLEADVGEVVVEGDDLLADVLDLCLEVVLLLVAEFAEVALVLLQHAPLAAPPLAHLSDEQLVEAEDVEGGHLTLEHHLRPHLVRRLLQRRTQQLRHRLQDPEHLPVQLLPEVLLGQVAELEGVHHRQHGQDAAEVGSVGLGAGLGVLLELGEHLGDLGFDLWEALDAVEEHGVDVGEDADDADGGVLLLVHDVEGEGDDEFGEDLEDEVGAEVAGGVGHDHGEALPQAVQEALLVVALPEVHRQPVRDLLVVAGQVDVLLHERLQRQVVEVRLPLLYQSCAGDLGDLQPQPHLVLAVVQLGVVADDLPPDDVVLLLEGLKLAGVGVVLDEGRPQRQLAAVLADRRLVVVGLNHGLLGLLLELRLAYVQVLLEEEALQLHQDALHAVGRRPPAPLLRPPLVLLQHVQADVFPEDVRVGDPREGLDGRRVVGVALGELQLDVEDSSRPGRVLGAAHVGVPGEEVVFEGTGHHARGGDLLVFYLLEVLHEALVGVGLHLLVDDRPHEGPVDVPATLLHQSILYTNNRTIRDLRGRN